MTSYSSFTSRATIQAQSKLNNFIEYWRERGAFGLNIQAFEDDAWDATTLMGKGRAGYIYFSRPGYDSHKFKAGRGGKGSLIPPDLVMREPFRSFAKAMMSYFHMAARSQGVGERIRALGYLEEVLHDESVSIKCPTQITPYLLDQTIQFAQDVAKVSRQTAGRMGKFLEKVYGVMVESGLLALPDDWTSGIRLSGTKNEHVGEEFDAARRKKLPDPAALEAIAEIFCRDNEDIRATFVSSSCALMLCSPDRMSEMLFAPANLLAEDWIDPETGEIGTGLRWFPAKGAPPMVKTVIPSMRNIAKRAVERLLLITEPARNLARWYENNPGRIYLPSDLEYLRNKKRVTTPEIRAILFGGEVRTIGQNEGSTVKRTLDWLRRKTVPIEIGGPNHPSSVAFVDLERAVLSCLPKGFPVMDPMTGMRYSEALCLLREGEYRGRKLGIMPSVFKRITESQFQSSLKKKSKGKTIFEERGYKNNHGQLLSLTSHQLRHYLNTLVRQSGRLSENDIANWSGRRNVGQNKVYDHESANDKIAKLQLAVGDPQLSLGPFSNINKRVFIKRDKFAQIKIITAHVTDIGYCIHDYAQSPCQVHQNCINCNEMVCVKGDKEAETNLRKNQLEYESLVSKAKQMFDSEVLGSAEWYKHQLLTLDRINQLISIIDDPAIPADTVIQLSGVLPASRIAMAKEARQITIERKHEIFNSLEDVQRSLTADE